MSNSVALNEAKAIMGKNIIDLSMINSLPFINQMEDDTARVVPFDIETLKAKSKDYMLIYGVDTLKDGKELTIRNLLPIFGKDPDVKEPCFYNQDWYLNEDFIDIPMKKGWFFIKKEVFQDSRAEDPKLLMKKYVFPQAITCVYAFFIIWLTTGEKLWYHDFIWCSDVDHNGDRIYVGKYHDVDQVNKNGFSIHRHLSLRPCYACID